MVTRVIITSGTSWTVPTDFDPSNNTLTLIGGGAGGATGTAQDDCSGGGGAACAIRNNLPLERGATLYLHVGAGGAHDADGGVTWINITANEAPTDIADGAFAVGGTAPSGSTGGPGGSAADCIGNTCYSGGNGGDGWDYGGGGGGGAAGPYGDGKDGGDSHSHPDGAGGGGSNGGSSSAGVDVTSGGGTAGGNGTNGTGGGAAGSPNGGNGTNGGGGGGGDNADRGGTGGIGGSDTAFDSTHGCGGGGGGGGNSINSSYAGGNGGNGGLYGGGGGAGSYDSNGAGAGGTGAQGIIVIEYEPLPGISASTGVFTLTGKPATLVRGRTAFLAPAVFTLTGQAASLRFFHMLAEHGAFVLTGIRTGAWTGEFKLTGQDATLRYDRIFTRLTAQFTLNGLPAGLIWSEYEAPDYGLLVKPANQQIFDPKTGAMRQEWAVFLNAVADRANALNDLMAVR